MTSQFFRSVNKSIKYKDKQYIKWENYYIIEFKKTRVKSIGKHFKG